MIRVMVGDTHRPYGFYTLDESDPNAKIEVTGFETDDGRSKAVAQVMSNMLKHLRNPGESAADLLLALPERLTSYQWARLITRPQTTKHKPTTSLTGGSGG
ncbi:MAG TPA: hypothetical protein VH393_04235 [Ktedonobacterales bacterium]|jgi:hypothetical protein